MSKVHDGGSTHEILFDAESVDLFTIKQFANLTGWKETTIRSKRAKSWTEGKEFVVTPGR